jgi:hypothetical protein
MNILPIRMVFDRVPPQPPSMTVRAIELPNPAPLAK